VAADVFGADTFAWADERYREFMARSQDDMRDFERMLSTAASKPESLLVPTLLLARIDPSMPA
jgi:hypothetical protein